MSLDNQTPLKDQAVQFGDVTIIADDNGLSANDILTIAGIKQDTYTPNQG